MEAIFTPDAECIVPSVGVPTGIPPGGGGGGTGYVSNFVVKDVTMTGGIDMPLGLCM